MRHRWVRGDRVPWGLSAPGPEPPPQPLPQLPRQLLGSCCCRLTVPRADAWEAGGVGVGEEGQQTGGWACGEVELGLSCPQRGCPLLNTSPGSRALLLFLPLSWSLLSLQEACQALYTHRLIYPRSPPGTIIPTLLHRKLRNRQFVSCLRPHDSVGRPGIFQGQPQDSKASVPKFHVVPCIALQTLQELG